MSKYNFLFIIIFYIIAHGCSFYAASIPRTILEGDNEANYQRIFGQQKPENTDIINSVVIDYQWRPGVVTTDDWEFELVVPKSWVDEQIKKWGLRKTQDYYVIKIIEDRKKHPIRDWYSPKDIESYELYYLYLTSIPYVHMLIEKDFKKNEIVSCIYEQTLNDRLTLVFTGRRGPCRL